MTAVATPDVHEDLDSGPNPRSPGPWEVVVWDDPVNLMSYVVHVFRSYFGYSPERATTLMLDVHNSGHAIVADGARELMELHAQAMHDHGLWATVRESIR